jgi:hypothetical protein
MASSRSGEAVTPQKLLLARLDAFATKCEEAKKAIQSTQVINPKLYERAAPGLLGRIKDERERISYLQQRTDKDQINDASWSTLCSYEKESSTLFGECLAFLQASRARGHDVDADLCEIADALLDELARLTEIGWDRFTVLATEEFFLDLAQIIRLRFPFSGIWDLPVSAHEFGHFVAGRLNLGVPDGLAFQEYKKDFKKQHADRGDEWMFYLEEYFADVFATFALGPAYACTCLFLRFDPAFAHAEEDKQHPSYAKRAHAILQTLLRMNREKETQGDFEPVADSLAKAWNQILISAGQSAVLAQDDKTQVGGLVLSFYEMLKRGVRRARFDRWSAAKALCARIEKVESPTDVQTAKFNIIDMLNAAWLCRMKQGSDSGELSDSVIGMYRLHAGAA